ncbi:MAG: hypothetical protein K2X72_25585 [Reyranella sp.]|nr:hypothetical protein [Reyranella sp.]
MQAICSIAAAILALASTGEGKAPATGMMAKASATSVQYGLPKLPSVPRLPSLPRLPKPKGL